MSNLDVIFSNIFGRKGGFRNYYILEKWDHTNAALCSYASFINFAPNSNILEEVSPQKLCTPPRALPEAAHR